MILPSLYYTIIGTLVLGTGYNASNYTVQKIAQKVKAQQHHERLVKKGC